MDKILITGCKGQLGTELAKLLPDAILADVEALDITNEDAVKKFVSDNQIDVIINCAAYTAVDKAEEDDQKERCFQINQVGPANLARSGVKKIIHISTDYVFDGVNNVPYNETDATHPVSVYGYSKLLGEQAVRTYASVYAIVRTAWLYSPYGNNFVKTMRRLGAEKDSINVVADQIGTPTYAGDLAQAIVDLIPLLNEETKGIYHYTNEGVCSWYDFAVAIMKKSGLKCQVNAIETADYPTKATRPAYSVLNKKKIKKLGIKIPHWSDGLDRCIKQM
ncbi:MAG: dTDP-4-dehydrorhamnose reductase [Alphaproteobacteria bacterium]|nr:dTDP-4-dehydrorhamnose reductase [Alphaproteobacteria bacterium]